MLQHQKIITCTCTHNVMGVTVPFHFTTSNLQGPTPSGLVLLCFALHVLYVYRMYVYTLMPFVFHHPVLWRTKKERF